MLYRKENKVVRPPIRYFVINNKTKVMHIFGFCQQTKKRSVPIRLFDSVEELEEYAGRPLHLCRTCEIEKKLLR